MAARKGELGPEARREQVLRLLCEPAARSIRDLAAATNAATGTILKDLSALEQAGLVRAGPRRTARRWQPTEQGRTAVTQTGRTTATGNRTHRDTPDTAPEDGTPQPGTVRAPRSRSTRPAPNRVAVPVLGDTAAGAPLLLEAARADPDETEDLVDAMRAREGDAAFLVRGSSMTDAGVQDGDLVVIRPAISQPARTGDLVLAAVRAEDEGWTVKRLEWAGNRIRLLPANVNGLDPAAGAPYEARTYLPEDVDVVGVLRWVVHRPR